MSDMCQMSQEALGLKDSPSCTSIGLGLAAKVKALGETMKEPLSPFISPSDAALLAMVVQRQDRMTEAFHGSWVKITAGLDKGYFGRIMSVSMHTDYKPSWTFSVQVHTLDMTFRGVGVLRSDEFTEVSATDREVLTAGYKRRYGL